VCSAGSDWERRHLLFRGWLRTHPADRDAYAGTKRRLARCDWPDMNAYAAAKTPIIAEIIAHASQAASSSCDTTSTSS
jgi:GrpB-like predicted nucleotidyltransferase (UPF0157 family)